MLSDLLARLRALFDRTAVESELDEELRDGVRPSDPATFLSLSLLLATVAILASYIPARRAVRVDAMVALRYE